MASFPYDQAEGLRRMVAGPRPRVLSVLSSVPANEKAAMLINLSASLAHAGSNVLVLDACSGGRGLAGKLQAAQSASLTQVMRKQRALADAVQWLPEGFSLAVLSREPAAQHAASDMQQLDQLFDSLAVQNDIVLIDAELGAAGDLPLRAMLDGDILIQVSDSQIAITQAYSLIKRLQARLGRRPFSLLVTGTSAEKAGVVYRNMAQAASRYLAVELQSVGCIPHDEHLQRATRLGRTVIDAFPLAGAAVAFRSIAGRYARAGVTTASDSSSEFAVPDFTAFATEAPAHSSAASLLELGA